MPLIGASHGASGPAWPTAGNCSQPRHALPANGPDEPEMWKRRTSRGLTSPPIVYWRKVLPTPTSTPPSASLVAVSAAHHQSHAPAGVSAVPLRPTPHLPAPVATAGRTDPLPPRHRSGRCRGLGAVPGARGAVATARDGRHSADTARGAHLCDADRGREVGATGMHATLRRWLGQRQTAGPGGVPATDLNGASGLSSCTEYENCCVTPSRSNAAVCFRNSRFRMRRDGQL